MRFRALIEAAGKTAAGIRVPDSVVEGLGAGKKPAVTVTIRDHTYRSTIASRGGVYLIGVSNENRRLAGVSAGETVDVTIEIDHAPRVVDVPADLAAALAADPMAAAEFQRLSYSNQLRHALPIAEARTAETRQRRVDKAVASLREAAAHR